MDLDSVNKSANTINAMYKKTGYFDEYGGSVIFFILLTILLFIGYSYSVVMLKIKPIKENWAAERCKPNVIPFAGFIDKPPGMTISEYTAQNFEYCMQNILISITGEAVQPITYSVSVLNGIFSNLASSFQFLDILMANIRSRIGSFVNIIFQYILQIIIPLQPMFVGIKDMMNKVNGIFTAALFTSLGTYYALSSFVGAIAQLIILILIALAILIVGFWILPFTWPFAISMTAIFVSVSIPLAIMLAFMSQVLHIQINSPIPPVPSKPNLCFDKDTWLEMKDGTIKKIKDIQPGDILFNDVAVTAKMTLSAKDATMYNLHNIIVSGNHYVKYFNTWIPVKKHPRAIRVLNYQEPFIYCLNTANKTIVINHIEFADWDEVYENEIYLLKKVVREKYFVSDRDTDTDTDLDSDMDSDFDLDSDCIHRYLDGGFSCMTRLCLKDGTSKHIKDICVHDILQHGEVVVGIVEIDGQTLEYQGQYNLGSTLGTCVIEGGPNLQYKSVSESGNKHAITTTLDIVDSEDSVREFSKSMQKNKEDKLYHLITTTGSFYIEDIEFYHYNSNIELFLENL